MPVSSKEFLDIQATIERGFTQKHVHDMIKTYSQRAKWLLQGEGRTEIILELEESNTRSNIPSLCELNIVSAATDWNFE